MKQLEPLKARLKQLEAEVAKQKRERKDARGPVRNAAAQPGPGPGFVCKDAPCPPNPPLSEVLDDETPFLKDAAMTKDWPNQSGSVADMPKFKPSSAIDTPRLLVEGRSNSPAQPSIKNSPSAFPSRRRTQVMHLLRPSVLGRVGLLALVSFVAFHYLYDRLMLKVSTDGIVSAPLTPIRARIDGDVVLGQDTKPGSSVTKGAYLFSVRNRHTDERTLTEFKAKLVGIDSSIKQIGERINTVAKIRDVMLNRGKDYRDATSARLEAVIGETNASLAGARAKAFQAIKEKARADVLSTKGIVPDAKTDTEAALALFTSSEVARLQASLVKYNTELASARRGIIIGEGYGDAPYSVQRSDDLEMRIAEMDAERAKLVAGKQELEARIRSEEERLVQQRGEDIVSPASGVLWNVRVGDGTWVSSGEALADLVDCSQSFVEASVPESGFESIHPGDKVKVVLSGSKTEVTGLVRSRRGSGAAASSSFGAAAELDQRNDDSGGRRRP